MSQKVNDESKIGFFIEQYRRCSKSLDHINSLAWNVYTSILVVTLGVATLAYEFLTNPIARGFAFLLNAAFVFLMLIQVGAYRRAADTLHTGITHLERDVFKIEVCPSKKDDAIEYIRRHCGWNKKDPVYHGFLVKQSAYFYYQYGLIIVLGVLIILGCLNLYWGFVN